MPIFTQTKYYVKIPEHFPENSLVTEVKAHDLDSGEYGELIYQLGDVSTKSHSLKDASNIKKNIIMPTIQDKQPFHIEQSTGVIKVLHNNLLDREQTEFLHLPIVAKDKGGLTATAQLIVELIDINDNPPKLISSTEIKVEENQKINTIIDSIHIIDLDKGKNSRIHLMLTPDAADDDGDVDGNKLSNKEITKYVKLIPDSRFNYSASTSNELISDGEMRALLISRMPFDRETTASVFYEIVCYDEGQPIVHSVTHTITIHVMDQNDNPPVCTYPIYNSLLGYHQSHPHQPHEQPMIHTNTPLHTLVTQIRGYDPDQGLNGTITYHLDKSTNGSQYFYVNQTTGELFTNWSPNFNLRHAKIQTKNPKHIDEPVVGVYQIRILLRDMGTPTLSKETQFYVKINPFNPSLSKWNPIEALDTTHPAIGSVPMNSKLQKIWLNNRFILILLIIFIIILIITIFGIVFWVRSHRKQKVCRSVKTIMSDQNVGNPVIMPGTTVTTPPSITLRNGGHRHNETLPILAYDGVADKSPIISHQPSHLLSACNESEQKFDGDVNTTNLVNTSHVETFNQFNSQWPDTSNVDQYTERNVKHIDRQSTYSHFSLNSDHNNNNNNISSNKNNYSIHQQTGTLNHLHTNPAFSFPLAYNTYNSSTMNGGGHRQSVGQKFNSPTYSTNPYYSASNNTEHNTLNSIGYSSDIVGYNNNNTMKRNTDSYANSPQQKQVQQSLAYSEHYYPHMPIIPDRGYYDQSQNQNENMKFW
ncbi:unnamed protein product [Trichobilharzia szidati]|nr:unnamed protein product [Trichobilharzia szidati]